MKGNQKIIELLNRQLTMELTAINQYFLHARMYKNWGLEKLGTHEYEESIEEMKHADHLIERILFLGGLPNLQDLGKLLIGENAPECISCDLTLEMGSREHLLKAVAASEAESDFVSRQIFSENLKETEAHIDYLETQLELIKQVGVENYLQSQMR